MTSARAAFTPKSIPWGDPARDGTKEIRTTRVVVLSGSLYLGYGDLLESERSEAGSMLVVSADDRHFDGSLEGTVIVGVARGVWATPYVDANVTPSAGTIS